MRQAGNRALVTEAAVWGELWRAHQDRYFAEQGLELRVDTIAATSLAKEGLERGKSWWMRRSAPTSPTVQRR